LTVGYVCKLIINVSLDLNKAYSGILTVGTYFLKNLR